MRTVADMLSSKQTQNNIISPNELVVDALRLMREVNLSYVVAMNGEKFAGIFSERNYARNVALEGKSSASCSINDAMDKDLVDVAPWQSAEDCIKIILSTKNRYLPVMQSGQLKGVITIHDILREVISSKEALFESSITELMNYNEGDIY